MAPLTHRFSNARRLAYGPSVRLPACPLPGWPTALPPIRTPPSSMGRTALPPPLPICV